MTTTIDTIIMEQIVDYISSHEIIKDNFNSIKELIDGEDYTSAIIKFLEGDDFNVDDDIVQPLYNMTEGFLSFNELREILSDGEEVVNILRYVYTECNDCGSLDSFGKHLVSNNMSKMFDLYMYFKAKELLNNNDDELLDKLVELYKAEEGGETAPHAELR